MAAGDCSLPDTDSAARSDFDWLRLSLPNYCTALAGDFRSSGLKLILATALGGGFQILRSETYPGYCTSGLNADPIAVALTDDQCSRNY